MKKTVFFVFWVFINLSVNLNANAQEILDELFDKRKSDVQFGFSLSQINTSISPAIYQKENYYSGFTMGFTRFFFYGSFSYSYSSIAVNMSTYKSNLSQFGLEIRAPSNLIILGFGTKMRAISWELPSNDIDRRIFWGTGGSLGVDIKVNRVGFSVVYYFSFPTYSKNSLKEQSGNILLTYSF